jgi:hypothetical protein
MGSASHQLLETTRLPSSAFGALRALGALGAAAASLGYDLSYPSEKYESVGMMTFPIYGKKCTKLYIKSLVGEDINDIRTFNRINDLEVLITKNDLIHWNRSSNA